MKLLMLDRYGELACQQNPLQPTIPDSQGQTSCYKLSVELCFGSVASFISSALPLTESKHEIRGRAWYVSCLLQFSWKDGFWTFQTVTVTPHSAWTGVPLVAVAYTLHTCELSTEFSVPGGWGLGMRVFLPRVLLLLENVPLPPSLIPRPLPLPQGLGRRLPTTPCCIQSLTGEYPWNKATFGIWCVWHTWVSRSEHLFQSHCATSLYMVQQDREVSIKVSQPLCNPTVSG